MDTQQGVHFGNYSGTPHPVRARSAPPLSQTGEGEKSGRKSLSISEAAGRGIAASLWVRAEQLPILFLMLATARLYA